MKENLENTEGKFKMMKNLAKTNAMPGEYEDDNEAAR